MTAKFDIVAAGKHHAVVTIDPDGKGAFSGTIVSPDFGTGTICNGVQCNGVLKGVVSLNGYHADFTAKVEGQTITGKLSYGWFFSEDFTGTQKD